MLGPRLVKHRRVSDVLGAHSQHDPPPRVVAEAGNGVVHLRNEGETMGTERDGESTAACSTSASTTFIAGDPMNSATRGCAARRRAPSGRRSAGGSRSASPRDRPSSTLRSGLSHHPPISLPGILTVVIFAFSLCVNEFIYAFTFISTSEHRTVSAGIPNDLIRGDVFFWQSLMAAVLIPTIPLALLYNAFLDRFIKGFTGGAFR